MATAKTDCARLARILAVLVPLASASFSGRTYGAEPLPARGHIPAAGSRACAGATATGYVAGTLTCISAQRLTLTPAGSAAGAVAVPLEATTQVCRAARGCRATWRDLRRGDYLDVGMAAGAAGQPFARWVDANMVTGDGTITARAAHSLTLILMPRGGQLGRRRVLFVGSTTIINEGSHTYIGSPGHLSVGQVVYFTASAESAHLLTARLWAIRIISSQ